MHGVHERGEVRAPRRSRREIAEQAVLQNPPGLTRDGIDHVAGVARDMLPRRAAAGGRAIMSSVHTAWHTMHPRTPPVHNARAPHTAPPTMAPATMGRFKLGTFAAMYAAHVSKAPGTRPWESARRPWTRPRQNSSSPTS